MLSQLHYSKRIPCTSQILKVSPRRVAQPLYQQPECQPIFSAFQPNSGYAREITENTKLYMDELKYGGTGENESFDHNFTPIMGICTRVTCLKSTVLQLGSFQY